jgi:hypothetical protein
MRTPGYWGCANSVGLPAASVPGTADKLPSDYKLYGAWKAGSTVEKGDFVDKGAQNSCSWKILKKECIIGIF